MPEMRVAIRQVRRGWARDLDEQGERIHQLAFFEVAGSWHELLRPARPPRAGPHGGPAALRARAAATRPRHRRLVRANARGHARGRSACPNALRPRYPSRRSSPPMQLPQFHSPARAISISQAEFPSPSPLSAGHPSSRFAARLETSPAREGLMALAVEHLSQPSAEEDTTVPALGWVLLDDPEAPVNGHAIEVTAAGLPDDVPGLLRVLAGRLQAPLPEDEGWKRLRTAARQRAEEREGTLATSLLARARRELFPPDSPTSRPPWGSPEAVDLIKREELGRFLREGVGPLRLVVAGDVTARGRAESGSGPANGSCSDTRRSVRARPRDRRNGPSGAWRRPLRKTNYGSYGRVIAPVLMTGRRRQRSSTCSARPVTRAGSGRHSWSPAWSTA